MEQTNEVFSNADQERVYQNCKFHDAWVKIMYNFDVMMCIVTTRFEKNTRLEFFFQSALISAILTHIDCNCINGCNAAFLFHC